MVYSGNYQVKDIRLNAVLTIGRVKEALKCVVSKKTLAQ
jgi:hypothetical protein